MVEIRVSDLELKTPCPVCGCRLYKESGPCKGEDRLVSPEDKRSTVAVPRALLHRIQVLCGDLGVQVALHNLLAVGADD